MAIQRYELEAWLGDNHGLTEEQIDELLDIARDIEIRYPDEDDADEREAALTVAYQLMVEDRDSVIDELAARLRYLRVEELKVKAALGQVAWTIITPGVQGQHREDSEAGFATRVGVHRGLVRQWIGK